MIQTKSALKVSSNDTVEQQAHNTMILFLQQINTEENYGCSWKDQVAKECGSRWKDAPDNCCSDFVCGQNTKKYVEL